MIQLRKIRYLAKKGGNLNSFESPLDVDITCENMAQLFATVDKCIARIPEEDRWNVYYTLGHTSGDHKRDWHGQDVIPFDIDGIVDEAGNFDEPAYLRAIFSALDVDFEKCIVVASGNGLQILVQPTVRIEEKSFFAKQRGAYERICKDIAATLTKCGLPFKEVDPSSFAANRIMRMPGTENRKPDLPIRAARLINGVLLPQKFALTPTPVEKTNIALTEKELTFFAIDTPAVEAGCSFLQWSKKNPADLQEPQWYALLSVLGKLENGRQLAHAYSRDHPSYSERDTDRKLDQALAASGPRTCENIDYLWGKCHECPNFKKVNSPVSIKSDTFIATAEHGFYKLGAKGSLTPQFEDLRRHFYTEMPYKTHQTTGAVYVFDGQKYFSWSETQLRNYAHEKFNPKPAEHHAREFGQWVNRTLLVDSGWFRDSTLGRINFRNGVLALSTGILEAHSPEFGFLYALPYDYTPGAACPAFDKFMGEITCGDKQLEELLLEAVGYSICDGGYWLQKAFLLIGEGSNGKSTFLRIVEELAGKANVAFLSLFELQSETSRSSLEGKLLNISDELPTTMFKNTELLKKLLGGTMTARRLYHDGTAIENSAKFFFGGNSIPETTDVSEGLFRRLVIIPFNARFKVGKGDGDIKSADVNLVKKMRAELPGIFNRILHHYEVLLARGHLTEAQKSTVEQDRYREQTDRVGSWIKENLYWNGSWDDKAPKIEINNAFEKYVSDAKRSEERPISKFHFTRHLRKHLDHFDERYIRQHTGHERPMILRGVEFRKDLRKEDF